MYDLNFINNPCGFKKYNYISNIQVSQIGNDEHQNKMFKIENIDYIFWYNYTNNYLSVICKMFDDRIILIDLCESSKSNYLDEYTDKNISIL